MDAETVPIMQSIIQKNASQKDKIIFITDHQNYSGITGNVIMTFSNGSISIQRQNQ